MLARGLVINRRVLCAFSWWLSLLEIYPSVRDQRAKQVAHQADHGAAVIDVAGGQPPVEHLALIMADQMELEAEKPPGRAFAPLGETRKQAVLVRARCRTDRQRGGVDKLNPRAGALA